MNSCQHYTEHVRSSTCLPQCEGWSGPPEVVEDLVWCVCVCVCGVCVACVGANINGIIQSALQVCTCTHTHLHIHTPAHTHLHIHTPAHTYLHTHTPGHMHAHLHTHTHTYLDNKAAGKAIEQPLQSRCGDLAEECLHSGVDHTSVLKVEYQKEYGVHYQMAPDILGKDCLQVWCHLVIAT